MFKHNLKALEFIIFGIDSKKIKIKTRDIWENFNLPNLEMVIGLDYNKQ